MALQQRLRVLAIELLGLSKQIEQRLDAETFEIPPLDRRAALRGDAPDAAVRVVAARVAEIDLAVLDDRVVPVGDVDRAVGPHLHVDRPEGAVRRVDEVFGLSRGEAEPPSSSTNEPRGCRGSRW